MAIYAIGDLQGCYDSFMRLLEHIAFDCNHDRLWLAGDLVNRGPKSLACLRHIVGLGDAALTVLGNHDLHLLAVASGAQTPKKKDTFQDILEDNDREKLLSWLRRQPLLLKDHGNGKVMTHAGIPHIWTVEDAASYAKEVEEVIQSEQAHDFFTHMYSKTPHGWKDNIKGLDRLRAITNYFTRMRFITPEGRLNFIAKETPDKCPEGFKPWFQYPRPDPSTLFFGHWAALNGNTGNPQFVGLDTGCVWGGQLTAVNIDTLRRYSVPAQE